MRTPAALLMAVLATAAAVGCTVPLEAKLKKIPQQRIPQLTTQSPVDVRPDLTYAGDRTMGVPGGSTARVSEDEFTTTLVTGVRAALESRGVPVQSGAPLAIEAGVVRVSIQPEPSMACVIDYNVKLGTGRVYGMQARGENWNFQTACQLGITEAVVAVVNEPSVLRYLEEGR